METVTFFLHESVIYSGMLISQLSIFYIGALELHLTVQVAVCLNVLNRLPTSEDEKWNDQGNSECNFLHKCHLTKTQYNSHVILVTNISNECTVTLKVRYSAHY